MGKETRFVELEAPVILNPMQRNIWYAIKNIWYAIKIDSGTFKNLSPLAICFMPYSTGKNAN